nr:MAG: hypothetical protein [Bacteriophage sp.]
MSKQKEILSEPERADEQPTADAEEPKTETGRSAATRRTAAVFYLTSTYKYLRSIY